MSRRTPTAIRIRMKFRFFFFFFFFQTFVRLAGRVHQRREYRRRKRHVPVGQGFRHHAAHHHPQAVLMVFDDYSTSLSFVLLYDRILLINRSSLVNNTITIGVRNKLEKIRSERVLEPYKKRSNFVSTCTYNASLSAISERKNDGLFLKKKKKKLTQTYVR